MQVVTAFRPAGPQVNDRTTGDAGKVDRGRLPLDHARMETKEKGRVIDHPRSGRAPELPASSPFDDAGLLVLARSMYRFRRHREAEFGPNLFSDPAWDILLDLFIAGEEGKKVSVSSACIGSSSPATTALRHLSTLVGRDLVNRKANDGDSRFVWVELTPAGREKVVNVLRGWTP